VLRVLLNKKYALPHVALDAVVAHFERFLRIDGPVPVVWHAALLMLAQRYKADLTAAQKETLRRLILKHPHPTMSHEVRRELASAGNRGDPVSAVVGVSSGGGGGGVSGASLGAGAGGRGAAVGAAAAAASGSKLSQHARSRGAAAMEIEY